MTTLSNQAVTAIADAVRDADYIADLGHYQTLRDRLVQPQTMLPIVQEAVSRSGFQPGDTYHWELAENIAAQSGQALANHIVYDIHDQIEFLREERGDPLR